MKRLKLLIYEPDHTGHHLVYLAFLLPAFKSMERVETTLLTTEQAVRSEEWVRTIGPHTSWLQIDTGAAPSNPARPLARARHRLHELRIGMKRLQPDHVIVMYADGVWQLLAAQSLFRRRPLGRRTVMEAWLWRGGFVYDDAPWAAVIKRWLFVRLLRKRLFDALHIDDDLLHDFATLHSPPDGPELEFSPNPVDLGRTIPREEARAALGLPTGGRMLALLAMIDARKGADLLLDAFRIVRERGGDDIRLVLAGPVHAGIRRMLEVSPYSELVERGAIIVRDTFISSHEMFLYASACDLMTAPYPLHSGRSSLVLWAAGAGRPTLGAARGCIGHVIMREGLGAVADPRKPASFADAVVRTLELPWTDDDATRARRYAERHSLEEFRRRGSALVRRQIEVPEP